MSFMNNKFIYIQKCTDCAHSRFDMTFQQNKVCGYIFILIGAPDCDCTKLILPAIALIKYQTTDHVLMHTETLQRPHQPRMCHV